jgi:putative hydrolase of the HAD superfamily
MYSHLFFDLDDTLWDYKANATETLLQMYEEQELARFEEFGKADFVSTFLKTNYKLWDDLDKGLITKRLIREERFDIVFEALGIYSPKLSRELNARFIELCPTKSNLTEGARDVLNKVKGKFTCHIITNGFKEVQYVKINSAGIQGYFDQVIISDEVESRKPESKIFDIATSRSGAVVEESLMIGDNLKTDIKGARDYGIDQVYFNPNRKTHSDQITYEISNMSDLLKIV